MQVPKLVVPGLLLCGCMLSLPRVSLAAAGCTNLTLNGTYNAQIENASIVNVLNNVNAPAAAGGSGDTAPAAPTGGFGNNANSLGGATPGLGRFFFDGNGVIVGQGSAGVTGNVNVGTYTVNYDCTATLRLNSGQTYNAVVTSGGNGILFIETDTAGAGVVGSMARSSNACASSLGSTQSFGFSLTGAQRTAPAASGSAGSGSTTTSAAVFKPFSTLGSLQLNPDGGFTMRSWQFTNGALQSVTASGTYTIGFDCSVKLTFAPTASGAPAPIALRGFLVDQGTGLFTAQPDTSNTVTGSFVVQ